MFLLYIVQSVIILYPLIQLNKRLYRQNYWQIGVALWWQRLYSGPESSWVTVVRNIGWCSVVIVMIKCTRALINAVVKHFPISNSVLSFNSQQWQVNSIECLIAQLLGWCLVTSSPVCYYLLLVAFQEHGCKISVFVINFRYFHCGNSAVLDFFIFAYLAINK